MSKEHIDRRAAALHDRQRALGDLKFHELPEFLAEGWRTQAKKELDKEQNQ